jgi:hypothetical protein
VLMGLNRMGPPALDGGLRMIQDPNMKSTRGSGTIDSASPIAIKTLTASIASLGFGGVLIGLSMISTAIERTTMSWTALAGLVLLTACGLALIGIIVQALSDRSGGQHLLATDR